MKEYSLLNSFSSQRLELAKAYIDLISFGENVSSFREIFTREELELIDAEIYLNKDVSELAHKLERIQKQREKKSSNSINSIIPIEEYGPFPFEVEYVLRRNSIDNVDDLLTKRVNLNGTTTDTRNYIEFMKKFYDFSNLENNKNSLTKTK